MASRSGGIDAAERRDRGRGRLGALRAARARLRRREPPLQMPRWLIVVRRVGDRKELEVLTGSRYDIESKRASSLWNLKSTPAKCEQVCATPRRTTALPAHAPCQGRTHALHSPYLRPTCEVCTRTTSQCPPLHQAHRTGAKTFDSTFSSSTRFSAPQHLPNASTCAAGMTFAARHAPRADGARPCERRDLARRG